ESDDESEEDEVEEAVAELESDGEAVEVEAVEEVAQAEAAESDAEAESAETAVAETKAPRKKAPKKKETKVAAVEDSDEESPEPDFVVEPPASKAKRPSRRARRDAKSKGDVPSAGADRETLLHNAGLMIIERERVAVSMFQREFDLPFQKATEILDELQERGLIGPYLGGRHRDILLTREQWEIKTPSS
ncbi:MAG: DNA segregation ATPase FtsK/SpoIIIE-like protein, partial [Planctomycetota bacterium]